MSEHYDEGYFDWQRHIGEFGGWAELIKFEEYIKPEMNVMDFGCGGGFVLKNLKCKGKIGIEINDHARKTMADFGITAFKTVRDAPDNWADCIISNDALEHVQDPFSQISALKGKLKKGGKAIFVVPCESFKYKYARNDINQHLFSWSPMNFGNIFTQAGYRVIESKTFLHKWPPFYDRIAKMFGRRTFHLLSRVYGHLSTSWVHVRVIAENE